MRAQEFISENKDLGTIVKSFVNSPAGQKYQQHDCKTVTRAFVAWADQNGIPTQVISLAPPSAAFIEKNPRFRGKSGEGDAHIMPVVAGNAIDFTVRQFGVNRPFEDPLITPINSMKSVYGRFGYFTDAPEWFLGGKSYWMGPLRAIPREIFNQDFGDEILEQGMAENFANGHTPADAVLDYVKRKHHDFRMDREVLMYPRWQLTRIPLSDLIIADYTDSDIDLDQVDVVKRDPERKINQSPIVVDPAGAIIDGNHRAFAARELGMTHIPAWRPVDDLDENFADKKIKGKSRPGRVKRAGASCKGSVTDLRARAKKYGGERGRMYHWCANMKSGRQKK